MFFCFCSSFVKKNDLIAFAGCSAPPADRSCNVVFCLFGTSSLWQGAGVFAPLGQKHFHWKNRPPPCFPDGRCAALLERRRKMIVYRKSRTSRLWKFCPKCRRKLYEMTDDSIGLLYIKCWRCRELLQIDLSERPK